MTASLTACIGLFLSTGVVWATPAPASTTLAYGWGYNGNGQLGAPEVSYITRTPVALDATGVLAGKTITQIASGGIHSMALCSDGTIAGWGYNAVGQLGNGQNTDSRVPVATVINGALAGKTITKLIAGGNHTLALSSDGKVFAWGHNYNGQLGLGNTTSVSVPTLISGALASKTVTQIAAGQEFSVALCSDGTLYSWGNNSDGQLGNGNTTSSLVPVAVSKGATLNGKTIIQLVSGLYNTTVLCSDGSVFGWGTNSSGQLGTGSTYNYSTSPVAVYGNGEMLGRKITHLASGAHHTLGLCADGSMLAWGYNYYGQVGSGSSALNIPYPVVVNSSGVLSGKTISQIAAGQEMSMVLCSDGTLATWGANGYGQLGNNDTADSKVPVLVDRTGVLRGKAVTQLMHIGVGQQTLILANSTNIAPVVNSVSITPNDPTTTTLLTATPSATDEDNDSLTYTYQWRKNGEPISGATGNTLDLSVTGHGDKGEAITVSVTANDGTDDSAPFISTVVIVGNTAPVMSAATIAPTSPDFASVLTATASATDVDSDNLTYKYQWKKNGNPIAGATGSTFNLATPGIGSGDAISVSVTANDGTANSDELTSASVTPVLKVSSVTINPTKPGTNSEVAAVATAIAPVGAKLTYTYQWKKNGINLPNETGRTMSLAIAGNGDRGDSITVEVRVSDGVATSQPLTSAPAAVGNSAPTVTSLTLTPTSLKTNTVLTAKATATDLDGDSIYFVYVWYKNGVKINGEEGATLDLGKPGNGDTGDKISVLVKARDYSAASAPVTSAELTIANSVPIMTSITLSPSNPGTNDIITATAVGYDPDGDITRFQYEWYKNGVKIPNESGATLDLSKTGNGDVGDKITVISKIRDYSLASAPMTSAPVTVTSGPVPLMAPRQVLSGGNS